MRRRWLTAIAVAVFLVGGVAPADAVSTSWSVTSPMPTPDQQSGMSSVSCATSTYCVAVGEDDVQQLPVIDVWNGSAWSSGVPAPLPSGDFGALFSVSCASPSFCVAVGEQHGATKPRVTLTLAEAWDGSSWSVVPSPNPGPQFNQFESVSCVSPTVCAGVGGEGSYAALPMFQAWDGVAWTLVQQPVASGGLLEGVSCISTFCLTVGTDDASHVLVEKWNFKTLSLVAAPPAVGSYNYAFGVSCVPRHWCAAVGYADEGSQTIAVHYAWDGAVWTTDEDALVTGYDSSLNRVACLARNDCVAVGGAQRTTTTGGTSHFALIESWNGRRWKRNRPPRVHRAGLTDVSCTSDTGCIAIGGYQPTAKTHMPYALANS